jgi:hypothetical protein
MATRTNVAQPCAVLMLRMILIIFSSLGALACSDDENGEKDEQSSGIEVEKDKTSGSLFAVMYEVFNGEDSDSYLSVFDSLDIQEIDTSKAREFAGGRAYLRVYNGWIFVGEPGAPTIRRFELSKSGELVEKGKLSLANYGVTDAAIDEWSQTFVSPTKAYFFDPDEGQTIVWNPTTMAIVGEIPAPDGFLREGYTPNTSGAVVRADRLYRSIYWQVDQEIERSGDQLLVVYDTKKDEIASLTKDERCAAPGNRAFKAEDGTLYFSNWIWSIADTLLYDAQKNCVLRVQPDADEFDTDWRLDFSEFAGGREGGMFTYLENGKGLASIFHDEDAPHDETTDPWEYAGSTNWEIWNVDVNGRTGAPLDGIPYSSGAYTPVTIDGRVFLMIPDSNWETTQLYELSDEGAKSGVKIPGWSYMFMKVRD